MTTTSHTPGPITLPGLSTTLRVTSCDLEGSTALAEHMLAPGGFETYFAELAALVPTDGPPDLGALAALGVRQGLAFDLGAMPALMKT